MEVSRIMIKKLSSMLVLTLILVMAVASTALGAGMDTSGRYDYNLNFIWNTDANHYTKNADTVDMSLSGHCNYLIGRHDWNMNLQLFQPITGKWNTVGFTQSGYTTCTSPSYRKFDINDFTWLVPPSFPGSYANARLRLTMTGGIYKGDVYYTTMFRIDRQ